MKSSLKTLFALAAVASAAQAAAQVTFYERENFMGRSFATRQAPVRNFDRFGFNDRASSAVVATGRWEVCQNSQFNGHCVVLRAGRYPSLAAMGLDDRVSSARPISRNTRVDDQRYAPAPAAAQVTIYEQDGFGGQSFTSNASINNLRRQNFNDRASSVVVNAGLWEVCEDVGFRGRCFVLRPGQYPSIAAIGLNNRITSVRPISGYARIEEGHYAPAPLTAPVTNPDFRRHNSERLFEANVVSVRAVVGPPEQRCWIEREQVAAQPGKSNVPGAIAGALIGGILGHQVGGGSGKDLATVGGVVAGAAIGAQAGRNGNTTPATTRDVQRCREIPSQAKPEFWDVTYNFRGQDHHVQLTAPPGLTVTVNEQGEPRN